MNYYKTLEIPPDASTEAIKKAYRRLAVRYHPDKNPNNPLARDRFQQISEAYSVLSNPRQRAAYDRKGNLKQAPPSPSRSRKRKGMWGALSRFRPDPDNTKDAHTKTKFQDDISLQSLGGVFGDFFKKNTRDKPNSTHPIRGDDLHREISLTLQEVAEGCRKMVDTRYTGACARCRGTGNQRQSNGQPCKRCGGIGTVESQHGKFLVKQRCPDCHGKGTSNQCLACHGSGRVEKPQHIVITLKPGIKEDTRLKVPKKGSPGLNGGRNGDLYVTIKVKPHRGLVRRGDDIYSEAEVDFIRAILGGTITAPTLAGPVRLRIPPGIQPNQLLRLRGKGLPNSNGTGIGDAYIRLKVILPVEITPDQRELLSQFYPDTQ